MALPTISNGQDGLSVRNIINGNVGTLDGRTDQFSIGVNVVSENIIKTTNTATQNKTNLLAWLAQSPIAKIRNDFGSRPSLLIPAADTYYPMDGEIDFTGTIRIIGGAASSRLAISSCTIKFANGRFGFRFLDSAANEPNAAAWWAEVKDLWLQPITTGGCNIGILYHVPVRFENVVTDFFKYAGQLGSASSGGLRGAIPSQDEIGSDTLARGNINLSLMISCAARNTQEGHGFVTSGNVAGMVTYIQCDAKLNNGCGYYDNDNIGCQYIACHSSQNTWKVTHHGGTLGATTNAAGYAIGATVITLAAAGVGSIGTDDQVQFAGDATWYGISATGGNANVSAGGTITLDAPGLTTAIPASATAISVRKFYTTVKPHVASKAAAAVGATTNAAGYAIGATVITLASAGIGNILTGDRVQFPGDTRFYTVISGDPDVSNGGSITLAGSGINKAIPASATAITVERKSTTGVATNATTNAAGYAIGATVITLASAGVGSINVGDQVQFPGDATLYTVTVGDTNVANGGSITIGGGGLAQAIPASATAITVFRNNTEPGVGANWKTYWVPVVATTSDATWTEDTFYRATGGINCIEDQTASNFYVAGCYSEGGIEMGLVPRGTGTAAGGNYWAGDGRAYFDGPEAGNFNHPRKNPTWTGTDGTNQFGSSLGIALNSGDLFNCGNTADTDVVASTPGKNGIKITFSPSRFAYEFQKGLALRTLAISAPNYSRSGYTGRGHVISEHGIVFGGRNGASDTPNTTLGRIMAYTSRAAIPSGTVLTTGDILVYTSATNTTDVAMEKVTVGGTTTAVGGVGVTFKTASVLA